MTNEEKLKALVAEFIATIRPLLSEDVIDSTSGTDPLIEAVQNVIDKAESFLDEINE